MIRVSLGLLSIAHHVSRVAQKNCMGLDVFPLESELPDSLELSR